MNEKLKSIHIEAEALAQALLERPAFERLIFLQRLKEMMEAARKVPLAGARP